MENMLVDKEAVIMLEALRTMITKLILIGMFTRAMTLTILTILGIAIRC